MGANIRCWRVGRYLVFAPLVVKGCQLIICDAFLGKGDEHTHGTAGLFQADQVERHDEPTCSRADV